MSKNGGRKGRGSMGIAMKTLLEQEFFKDFYVVGGAKGLQREVQGIAIMDAPDAYRWTKGKELVITSGYSIRMEPDSMKQAFDEGMMQQTSGMMIKRGRHLPQISQEIIDLFDQYEIPLVSMPFEISYMDVMQQINTIVLNRTIRRFQIQKNGAFSLWPITYKVQKIKKILQAVEVEMDFPAFLFDVGEKEGYYSSANFKRISEMYGLKESDFWEPSLPHNRYTLCDYIQMTRIRLCNEREEEPRVSWVVMPITVGGVVQAYFVVMESREFLDYYDEYSIRIAYLLLQALYEQIVIADSIGNNGFENLVLLALHSTGENTDRLLYQASQQGISMNTRYACVLFEQKNETVSARINRDVFFTAFQNSNLSQNAKLAFLDENRGVMLAEMQEPLKYKNEDVEKMLLDFEEKIQEKCSEIELEFAVLREGNKLSEVKSVVAKCEKILKMGRKLYPERKVWDYDLLGLFTWLQIPEDELEHLLLTYKNLMKDEKNVELLKTLKVYLENNMNFSVTAEKMYVHINTIRKRIDKLNSLLEIDWDSYMSRLKAEILLQFLDL